MSAFRALRLCAPAVVLVSVVSLRGACAQSADEHAVIAANTAFDSALSTSDAIGARGPLTQPTPRVAVADKQCSVATIDLPLASKERSAGSEADCEERYPKACDPYPKACKVLYPKACNDAAIWLIHLCKEECGRQREYNDRSYPRCKAKLPVTTHRPEYLDARDCALEGNQWTVSCTVTAQSCACN